MRMINKKVINALKSVSYGTSDIKNNYKSIRNFWKISHPFDDDIQKGYIFADGTIKNIPVRIFYPDNTINNDVIIWFHGGGWVTGDTESYSTVCSTMALRTSRRVIAVEYRLAPENKFPCAVEDAYKVVKAVSEHDDGLDINAEKIIIGGDSAGGNISASVCLMAQDRNEHPADMQILIYPVTSCDYTLTSEFQSVHEFRDEYFLTVKRMNDYVELYSSDKNDWKNPYFSPLLHENPINQPDTLIITAEYDILRDEGEAYGKKLIEYGNRVEIHRINDALHGFIVLPVKFSIVNECYELIRQFIDRRDGDCNDCTEQMEQA